VFDERFWTIASHGGNQKGYIVAQQKEDLLHMIMSIEDAHKCIIKMEKQGKRFFDGFEFNS
jgi:hypothetical protein